MDTERATPQQKKDQCDEILSRHTIHEIIKPRIWGPSCWTFLHHVALAYPLYPTDEDKAAVHRYFHALKEVLPCYTCKRDFAKMMDDDPIEFHLQSRESLCRWLHDKHNQVNAKTGAPTMEFEESILRCALPPTQSVRKIPLHNILGAQSVVQNDAAQGPEEYFPKSATFILVGVVLVIGVVIFLLKSRKK